MENIFLFIKQNLPCPIYLILGSIVFVLFFIFLKKRTKFIKASFFSLIIGIAGVYASEYYIQKKWPQIDQDLCGEKAKKYNLSFFRYDTNPSNNDYIKKDLTVPELKLLDRVLLLEKRKSGLNLSDVDLQSVARNNRRVMLAYERWCECKLLMRSNHHVFYPDERAYY